jgi:deoxycytidine triphosphate deaminase
MTANFAEPSRFAFSKEEAERRFKEAASKDPFPNIQPALLNSADIFDYVAKTAMIWPFKGEEIKSASYPARIGRHVVSWQENGKESDVELRDGEAFTLAPNSITFIETEEVFRLPDYIALRFNLKISNVHKGLLLGTGPLVDPGFEGKLLIPLHNLTSNDYVFRQGFDKEKASFGLNLLK